MIKQTCATFAIWYRFRVQLSDKFNLVMLQRMLIFWVRVAKEKRKTYVNHDEKEHK